MNGSTETTADLIAEAERLAKEFTDVVPDKNFWSAIDRLETLLPQLAAELKRLTTAHAATIERLERERDDLAMLVKRFVVAAAKGQSLSIVEGATGYLKRHGLMGSIIREEQPNGE